MQQYVGQAPFSARWKGGDAHLRSGHVFADQPRHLESRKIRRTPMMPGSFARNCRADRRAGQPSGLMEAGCRSCPRRRPSRTVGGGEWAVAHGPTGYSEWGLKWRPIAVSSVSCSSIAASNRGRGRRRGRWHRKASRGRSCELPPFRASSPTGLNQSCSRKSVVPSATVACRQFLERCSRWSEEP